MIQKRLFTSQAEWTAFPSTKKKRKKKKKKKKKKKE